MTKYSNLKMRCIFVNIIRIDFCVFIELSWCCIIEWFINVAFFGTFFFKCRIFFLGFKNIHTSFFCIWNIVYYFAFSIEWLFFIATSGITGPALMWSYDTECKRGSNKKIIDKKIINISLKNNQRINLKYKTIYL